MIGRPTVPKETAPKEKGYRRVTSRPTPSKLYLALLTDDVTADRLPLYVAKPAEVTATTSSP